MTRLLLHGPAKAASRKKLIELKQKFDVNNVVVYEEGSDLQILKTALSSQSLFSSEQLLILENPPGDLSKYELITNNYELILWFDHEVDTKKWPNFTPLFFPEGREISVFPLLDYLAGADPKAFFEMKKLKEADFDIYYFLTMIFYLIRNLAVTPKRVPDFVRKKLERQRENFSLEKITKLYKEMIEIDFKIKSGLLEIPQAEFLMVNKFME